MEIAIQRIADWIAMGEPDVLLDLYNLGLTKFPPVAMATRGLPSGLRYLDLSNNQIREIPDTLPSGLQSLHLDNNQIETIPKNLPHALRVLYLSNNQICEIPLTLPSGLQSLHLHNNQICEIPDTLPSGLQYMDFSCNQIREIPEMLPSNLHSLYLCNNPVSFSPYTKDASESWSSYARRLAEEKAATRAAFRCLAFRDELCYATTTMSH